MIKKISFIISLFILTMTPAVSFHLKSPAFVEKGVIPAEYSCDGANLSPELNWARVPEGTKSFVLLVEDPDTPVGTFDHWIVYNIPANVTSLPKGIKELPQGAKYAANTTGKDAYTGPCPPDKEHRYIFNLFALDEMLDLKEGATKSQVQIAMFKHILGRAVLIGRYNRPQNIKTTESMH